MEGVKERERKKERVYIFTMKSKNKSINCARR